MDHVYVQFYNNYCYAGSAHFESSLDKWLQFANGQPHLKVMVGLSANTKGAGDPKYYNPPEKLAKIYNRVRDKPGVGGIMLWDVSFDQNKINGRAYSSYAFALLKRGEGNNTGPTEMVPTSYPTGGSNTTGPTEIGPTSGPTEIGPTSGPTEIGPTQGGEVDCKTNSGYFAYAGDPTKYIVCENGRKHLMSCPGGLVWNQSAKSCDWPKSKDQNRNSQDQQIEIHSLR